ncbi:MAG: hypothetical protein JO308_06380 [Verrucomicrobia bacterium]|nr:hypothetical protein [Verrucomicrobiota bacterium]
MTGAVLIATLILATRTGAMMMIIATRITSRIIAIITTIAINLRKLETVDAMLNTAPSSDRARIENRPEVEPSLTSTALRYRLSAASFSAELAGGAIVLK